MPLTVVYRASLWSVDEVLHLLRSNGFEPTLLDPRVPLVGPMYGTVNYTIRIGVPDSQAPEAVQVLSEWERQHAPSVEQLSRGFRHLAIRSLFIVVAVVVVSRIYLGNWEDVPWGILPVAFLVIIVVMSALQNIGSKQEGQD